MASYNPPARATEYIFFVGLRDQANANLFKSAPTLASGDVKVSKDGGSLTNLSTLPAVTPGSSAMVKVTLSATEMTADNVTVVFSDASGDEWADLMINLQTVTNQFDDLNTTTPATAVAIRSEMDSNSTQLAAIVADTNELQTDDVPGLISGLNDLTAAEVNAQVDTALADYDAPTKAELDAGLAGLNDLTAAEVNAQVDTALADYDAPTKAELDAGLASLNDPSAAAVADAVWEEAIADHDGTSGSTAEALDSAGGGVTAAAIADAVWEEAIADHDGTSGSTAEALDAAGGGVTADAIADAVWNEALSGHVGAGSAGKVVTDIETDVTAVLADTNELQSDDVPGLISGLNDLTAAEVNAEVDTALADYDGPTKAELDAGLAGLNDLTAAQVNTEVDAALADYDAPTKAEFDAGLAGLSVPTATAVALAVWAETTRTLTAFGFDVTVGDVLTAALAKFFSVDSGTDYGSAVDGSVVKEIADNANVTTLGTGAITFDYTLTSGVDSSPIENAQVWVTRDLLGLDVVASGYTDGSGIVTFYLDSGTYYIWRQKSGWNFDNPDIEVVA